MVIIPVWYFLLFDILDAFLNGIINTGSIILSWPRIHCGYYICKVFYRKISNR